MNDEIWKDIKDYEGLYQVSNYGRIKSLARLIPHNRHVGVMCNKKEKIIKLNNDKDGYKIYPLHKDGSQIGKRIHRLVAEAFIPNPLNLSQINHKDGDKTNNNVWNLEWCDNSSNQLHARDNGLNTCFAENHPLTKLSNEQVNNIRNVKTKINQAQLAIEYNVSPMCISRILNNKSWKRI